MFLNQLNEPAYQEINPLGSVAKLLMSYHLANGL